MEDGSAEEERGSIWLERQGGGLRDWSRLSFIRRPEPELKGQRLRGGRGVEPEVGPGVVNGCFQALAILRGGHFLDGQEGIDQGVWKSFRPSQQLAPAIVVGVAAGLCGGKATVRGQQIVSKAIEESAERRQPDSDEDDGFGETCQFGVCHTFAVLVFFTSDRFDLVRTGSNWFGERKSDCNHEIREIHERPLHGYTVAW